MQFETNVLLVIGGDWELLLCLCKLLLDDRSDDGLGKHLCVLFLYQCLDILPIHLNAANELCVASACNVMCLCRLRFVSTRANLYESGGKDERMRAKALPSLGEVTLTVAN